MVKKHTTSRTEQILNAAFALTAEKDNWSLSEVAERVSVSKTALYRHFKNRAEIEAAMEGEFRTALTHAIERAGDSADSVRHEIVVFFRQHEGYLHLFMKNFFSSNDYETDLFKWLVKHSPRVERFYRSAESLSKETRKKLEIAVMKSAVSVIISSFEVERFKAVQDELLERTGTGYPNLALPDDRRLNELDALSSVGACDIGETSRLFEAISEVIKKQGMEGTTIDKIAEQMGMAKSSLYFYYPTKEAMLEDLVKSEMKTMIGLVSCRVGEGKTFAEQLYLVMVIQAQYLLKKEDFVPVFSWIRQQSVRRPTEPALSLEELQSFLLAFRYRELGEENEDVLKTRSALLLKWASILATSLVINGRRTHSSAATIAKDIRALYMSMMRGDKEIL